MIAGKAIALLAQQKEGAERLKTQPRFSPEFTKWKRDTEVVIENIFGTDTRHLKDFREISYRPSNTYGLKNAEQIRGERYLGDLEKAKQVLASMSDEIKEFGLKDEIVSLKAESLQTIENICSRFHLIARQLRVRHQNRETLDITDEYDVQDLFHALLHLYFDDIRSEEWTGSYAGKSSRMDFLLQNEQIGIELKKTRKGLANKEVSDQLIIDKERYKKKHPDCRCLVCFVYDPEARITNPIGFENDLKEEGVDFKAIVIVAPKGR